MHPGLARSMSVMRTRQPVSAPAKRVRMPMQELLYSGDSRRSSDRRGAGWADFRKEQPA